MRISTSRSRLQAIPHDRPACLLIHRSLRKETNPRHVPDTFSRGCSTRFHRPEGHDRNLPSDVRVHGAVPRALSSTLPMVACMAAPAHVGAIDNGRLARVGDAVHVPLDHREWASMHGFRRPAWFEKLSTRARDHSNCKMGTSAGSLLSALGIEPDPIPRTIGSPAAQDSVRIVVHDLRVLLHFVLEARIHSRQTRRRSGLMLWNAVRNARLDALVGNAARGQNLECEAGLRGLAHHLVHPRRIALQIKLPRHFDDFAVQICLISSGVRVRL